MRVALLKGQSVYGVLRAFVDDVAAGFVARGWDAQILDFEHNNVADLPKLLAAGGPLDLVFSVNAFAEFRDGQGRTITDLTGAPHILQYVDYPLHTFTRFCALPQSTAVLLVDHSHVRTVNALFGEDRFAFLGFGPHGGLGAPVAMPQSAAEWAQQRPIQILFAASNYKPSDNLWEGIPDMLRGVFKYAVDMALATEWIAPLDALDAALAAHGLDPRDPTLGAAERQDLRNIRILASLVQETVRRERRQRFVAAARKVGLPLTVVGNGWNGVPGIAENKGPVAIEECISLMRQARLCISLSGNFGEGSHERPLSAMLAGAAVACDATRFYEQSFAPQREIALFHWMSLEADLARLTALSRNTEALFAMAELGHSAASRAHRWDNRVDTYLDVGRAVSRKLGLSSRLAA